jgi:hypothetical protein
MSLTKEKILAICCALVGVFVVASARVPAAKAVEPVPAEEPASNYRRGPGSIEPVLAPERTFRGRDPFKTKDPWSEAPPALLAVPPAKAWPRALPGGVEELPGSPRDRRLEGGAR